MDVRLFLFFHLIYLYISKKCRTFARKLRMNRGNPEKLARIRK